MTTDGAWCLVSREYPPRSGGGIGTYAETFARLLAERMPVVVITTHAGARAEATAGNLTVIRLPLEADDRWLGPHPSIASPEAVRAWNRLGPHSVLSLQVAGLVPELLDRFGVRVIEGCDTGAPLWHLLDDRTNAKWSADVRIITHAHSPSAWIERLNRRLEQSDAMHELQRMEREQTQRSDTVVTPSASMQDWLRDCWGVHADVIRYPYEARDAAPQGTGGLLFVGRLEYRKGIDTLLRAWPIVETDRTLSLVGRDVIDYRTNTSIAKPMLTGLDRVELLGPQPPERVHQLQDEASVVVVPSPDDNFPFTCIEAMTAGRVVVAANAGGASEMIGHGISGLLFEPYDANGLAHALTQALRMSDPERAAMGAAARARIAELCDTARVVEQRIEHAARGAATEHKAASSEVPIELRRFTTRAAPRPSLMRRITRRLTGR